MLTRLEILRQSNNFLAPETYPYLRFTLWQPYSSYGVCFLKTIRCNRKFSNVINDSNNLE